MSSRTKYILIAVALLIIVIQFVPVDRDNPSTEKEMEIQAPPEIKSILTRSCYDCHSNQTEWPFYSYIAPVSWLVADDVHEGRGHINFSRWQSYTEKQIAKRKEHIVDEIMEDGMPLPKYLWMHPSAKLSDADKELLKKWLTPESEE